MATTEDAASLLELLRRTTDDQGWLQPQLDDPDAAAIIGARISIFARLGPAVTHNAAQATISSASGGSPGTSTVIVSRVSGATTGTIPKGFAFIDARGARAVLQLDVIVGAQTTLALPVQTLRQTELVNTEDDPGFSIDPQSPVVPASAGVLIAPAGTGGLTANTFQTVGPSTPITGGAADYLSVQGAERGIYRQPGETTGPYRQRVLNIPDAVSPIAIADVVQAAAQQPGIPPLLTLEPFEDGATPALKTLHGLGSFSGIAWDVDFRDDPFTGFVMLDRRMGRAYFLIQAQDYVVDTQSFGVFWDDLFFDDPILGYPGDIDIFPPTQSAALLSIASSVDPKRAGGVQFDIALKSGDLIEGKGTRTANTFGEVVTLTPAAGTIWYLSQVLAGHDSPTPSAAIAHHLTFDLEGGASFTTADFSQVWTEIIPPPGARVTAVHGFLKSDGSITANLVVYLRAIAVKL
jgi:hypothetical protein